MLSLHSGHSVVSLLSKQCGARLIFSIKQKCPEASVCRDACRIIIHIHSTCATGGGCVSSMDGIWPTSRSRWRAVFAWNLSSNHASLGLTSSLSFFRNSVAELVRVGTRLMSLVRRGDRFQLELVELARECPVEEDGARCCRTKVRKLGRHTANKLETISTRAQTSVDAC
jgi:hypothetical protein